MSRATNITIKIKNRIFAIPAEVAAIPLNPKTAAIIAITRNIKAQPKSPIFLLL
jgi:hypothetical protein